MSAKASKRPAARAVGRARADCIRECSGCAKSSWRWRCFGELPSRSMLEASRRQGLHSIALTSR